MPEFKVGDLVSGYHQHGGFKGTVTGIGPVYGKEDSVVVRTLTEDGDVSTSTNLIYHRDPLPIETELAEARAEIERLKGLQAEVEQVDTTSGTRYQVLLGGRYVTCFPSEDGAVNLKHSLNSALATSRVAGVRK